MKNYTKLIGTLIVTAFVFIWISCQPQPQKPGHMDSYEQNTDTVPLIYHMSFMQRYATKLYFSGMAENWGLADIYAHEIEELAEVIIEGNHVDDEVNVSELLETMLPPEIEQIELAIDAKDKAMFERNYQTMIRTCNKCHQSANYGLVNVTVPETNPYAQDFSAPDDAN
ncbi:MAG: hypothetical protein WD022_08900 [Balneolaceae bacterium]